MQAVVAALQGQLTGSGSEYLRKPSNVPGV